MHLNKSLIKNDILLKINSKHQIASRAILLIFLNLDNILKTKFKILKL